MGRASPGWAFFFAACTAASAAAVELTDDRGVTLKLAAPASRIIALSPHLAEIVFAAGAGAKLRAVVRHSDYPAPVRELPRVGEASRIDLERVIALAPDLMLAWRSGNPVRDVERLERLGYRVFVTEPRRLADIPRLVRAIGTLAGTQTQAEIEATRLERELDALRTRYGGRTPVRVFYEIWHRPLLTVNGEHLISDVIGLCGGVNVFAQAPTLTPSVSLEAVLAARPQIVLGGGSATSSDALASEWQRAPVEALRALPVGYVSADVIQRQTPRIVQGARTVCGHLEGVRVGHETVSGKR